MYRVNNVDVYIDVNAVDQLHNYKVDDQNLTIGANTSLNTIMNIFEEVAKERPQQYSYLRQLIKHIDLVANVPVRNVRLIIII